MGPGDVVTAALILAGAGWLLYRSLWKSRGGCPGCSSAGACKPAAAPRDELVKLGSRTRSP